MGVKINIKWIIITVLLIMAVATYFTLREGDKLNYDSFAQCLTDNGAVMYGTYWCSYCNAQKGDFGDAFIYFNGKDGVGEGHSASNLDYYSIYGQYRSDTNDMIVNLALYNFNRNQPVYYEETDGTIKKSKDIGNEFDFEIIWQLEEKLQFGFQAAIFLPGNAYSSNDNIRPVENPEDFSLLGLNVNYIF